MTRTLVALLCLARVAHAEDKPDPTADIEGREANLESKQPRNGFTISAALGIGIMVGGDIGVGRGPAISIRIGQVATRETVITFEVVGTGALHKESTMGETLTDTSLGLFAGAQHYPTKSLWIRAAGGLDVLWKNVKPDGTGGTTFVGAGALIGSGLDIIRLGYFVLGLEAFGMTTLTKDGPKLQLGFSLGASYY